MRQKRRKGSLLGTMESFTRHPRIRKNARYPVIRFEADGVTYPTYGKKPVIHPPKATRSGCAMILRIRPTISSRRIQDPSSPWG